MIDIPGESPIDTPDADLADRPYAIPLHPWEFVGTAATEWSFIRLGDEGTIPGMIHHPSRAVFMIARDEATPEDVMPRCAVPVSLGDLDPRDRTALTYLGRASVWFYVMQIPEIQRHLAVSAGLYTASDDDWFDKL